jgi:prophage antirepressor-like protein
MLPESEVSIFQFADNQEIRVILIDNEPWFVAQDTCKILDLIDVSMSLQKLDDDEKLTVKILQSGQRRDMRIVNESGLYALVLKSYKPQAKAFRKWITSEVLPQIRKTGIYQSTNSGTEYLTYAAFKVFADNMEDRMWEMEQKVNRLERKTEKLPQNLEAFVYLMHNPQTNEYKIGRSADLETRQKVMQAVEPNIKIILMIPSPSLRWASTLEKFLHTHFAHKQTFLEWFKLDELDLQQIHTMAKVFEFTDV